MILLRQEIEKYSGEADNGYTYLAENKEHHFFATVSIGEFNGKHVAFADLIVRVIDNKIVIDDDRNSEPFYEALMDAGIPRDRIILAYAGEPVPDTLKTTTG